MIDAVKFWGRVVKTDTCWLWQGTPDVWGYGRYNSERVHRITWILQFGPIPLGCRVKITCRNRMCVRHLEIRLVQVLHGAGCIEWSGGCNDRGYGQKTIEGEREYVHRRVWEMVNGPLAIGQEVLHRCDNPPCYNYDHLFVGTQADNMEDMIAKGRAGWQRRSEISV